MRIVKALMLASLTVVSLGAGSVMAQDGGPTGGVPDYWAEKYAVARLAGASTVDQSEGRTHSFSSRSFPIQNGTNQDATSIGGGN